MSSGINLALVGASGVVGDKIISLLEKKNINVSNFYPLGFSSVGRAVSFNNKSFIIEDLSNFDSSKAHLAIFSAGSKVAKEYPVPFACIYEVEDNALLPNSEIAPPATTSFAIACVLPSPLSFV